MSTLTTTIAPVRVGERLVGPGEPVYVIAEIGINHNGDLELAKRLIDAAAAAGADAVKFQKRTPELSVPADQRDVERDTPWGRMTYLAYRYRVEFDQDGYAEIDRYCREVGIDWFASPWDEEAVDFLAGFDLPAMKVASASLTDDELLIRMAALGTPVIASTGMSTMAQIDHAFTLLPEGRTLLAHATSSYPCSVDELNLRMLHTLAERFAVPVGYSGHETGLATTLAAVALGATFLERHITLDRAMWGTDQSASVEPGGFAKLVEDVRKVERALGDGIKQVYESELAPMAKLRRRG
jgi:N-acetylneuraminate synthase